MPSEILFHMYLFFNLFYVYGTKVLQHPVLFFYTPGTCSARKNAHRTPGNRC